MNELQDTLEEIMKIFSSQEEMLDIMEEQQKELDFLRIMIQKQDELLKKLNNTFIKICRYTVCKIKFSHLTFPRYKSVL